MAKRVDIAIDQGSKWTKVVQVYNPDGTIRNLTGYSAKMDIKEVYTDISAVLQLTSPSGGLVVNGPAGQVTITITAAQTTAMSWTTGVYDLKVTPADPNGAERIIEGSVGVFPQVTV